jgi:hypothetical protein
MRLRMSASFAALQLGFLPWKVKWCQESVWSDSPTDIQEIDDLLGEFELALPAMADRITPVQRSVLIELLRRMEKRHRHIAGQNIDYSFSLVDTEGGQRRRDGYRAYLADETNHFFRQWQKEDWSSLRDLLAAIVKGDKRLQGYFEIGDHLGGAEHVVKRASGSLSKKDRNYILSGVKKLPLREQREIEPFFVPMSLSLFALAKRIQNLGRFLKAHEDDLVAKPKWDGKTIPYRRESEEVKIQDNSVIGLVLDEGEKQQWTDSIKNPKCIQIRKKGSIKEVVIQPKSIANAIGHFHREHKIVEFSVNGDRLIWGPPKTVKERARGIAKRKTRQERT